MKHDVFRAVCDLPYTFKAEQYDSDVIVQNKTCSKCRNRTCTVLFNSNKHLDEHLCHEKFNSILLYLNDAKFVLNGLVFDDNHIISKERKAVRMDYFVTRNKLSSIISKITKINEHMTTKINDNIEQNFSIFHDVKTSVGLVYNCVETFINKQPGNGFIDKLRLADQAIIDLYSSLDLVTSQLTMIDIFVNPQSISYGNKKAIEVFKMFDKIYKLFNYRAVKAGKNIFLKRDGGYIQNSMCFPSIELVAIILLDNALKYSMKNSNITITLSALSGFTRVNVSSYGWPVPVAERQKLFTKFFRGTNATRSSSSGLGVGLWMVRKILEAHNSKIHYNTNVSDEVNGNNSFEFLLPTVEPEPWQKR